MTREIPETGLLLVFFVMFLIWTTDSGAYFVGRTLGKHKLWPDISPKKTIEGSIGGMIAAIIVGSIFHFIVPIFSSYFTALLFILVASIFGQLGDLVESALKRHYAVKDSGNVLPGHGGILDRFDSLIYVMPILHLLQLI
jgi:phosphatidate cytidylyltransferase